MKYRDYYEILGVDKTADNVAIRKAYRKLAKKYHPDHNPDNDGAEAKFKEVAEAYEVLKDKEKRQKYDQFGHDFDGRGGADFDPGRYGFNSSGFQSAGGDYSDFFNMFFGSDVFGSMNGMGSRGRSRSTKGQDVEATMHLTIEEAYHGGKRTFTLHGKNRSSITVNIPKGMLSGEKIRLKGKGEPSPYGGPNGDLKLVIQIDDSKGMTLEGLNISSDLEVLPWEAWFGSEKTVETLDGTSKVSIPAQIQSGKKIRLKDKGFKNRKGQQGHLIMTIKIVNPSSLSEEQEVHYMAMANH